MNKNSDYLEILSNEILSKTGTKPNYSNRDFLNCIIIFQNAIMDKMYDLQLKEEMALEDMENMATSSGNEIRRIVKTFTGFDTHDIESFL